jgi:uncharacterized cupredoxin-like copper-binding protein
MCEGPPPTITDSEVHAMKALAMTTAALLVVAVLGCGSDEDEEPAAQRAASGSQTVAVSETEFKLDPADPKVDKGVVTFKVSNDGKATHSLEVEGPDGEVELDKALQPGRSGTLEVNLSRAGKYEWYCPIDGHKDSGMRGEITVGDGGSAGAGGAPNDADEGGGGLSY